MGIGELVKIRLVHLQHLISPHRVSYIYFPAPQHRSKLTGAQYIYKASSPYCARKRTLRASNEASNNRRGPTHVLCPSQTTLTARILYSTQAKFIFARAICSGHRETHQTQNRYSFCCGICLRWPPFNDTKITHSPTIKTAHHQEALEYTCIYICGRLIFAHEWPFN